LRLVHVQLRCHGLHLVGLLLEVLLVDTQLLSNFGAGLASKQVLKLNIQLLLLLDDHIFLHNLFSLLNQALLQRLNLHEHLPRVWVGSFKLPPPMVVQRVLQFLTQCLDLQFLYNQIRVQLNDLLCKAINLSRVAGHDSEFALQITDLILKKLDVFKTFTVLAFSLLESGLQNLDLFVQQSQLVIAADQLCAKNISFVLHLQVLLLLGLILLLSFVDCVLKRRNALVSGLILDLQIFYLLLMLRFDALESVDLLPFLSQIVDALCAHHILLLNFVFKLRDLNGCNLELAFQFGDLVLRLQ